ncbi:MAG: isoprenyl transferase [Pseudomonadota bacterium]
MVSAAASPVTGGDGPEPPRHVAIIMDGNGRWATSRGLPRAVGHERGVEALRRTVEAAQGLGLHTLTVFSFSTENWRRPASEVSALFGLLKSYVKRDLDRLAREGVRVRILGTRSGLPADIADLVDLAEKRTAENTAFNLCIAFNYGGREEIVRAAQKAAEAAKSGDLDPDELDEAMLSGFLDTADLSDPDLLIRTSGESRLSNFLIWQCAYAELIFMDVLWPDFGAGELRRAIDIYMARERRFGGLVSGAA